MSKSTNHPSPTKKSTPSGRRRKARNRPDVYARVTERICELLEMGVKPWQPGYFSRAGIPTNYATGREYRGVNVFLLGIMGYPSPYFMTYKQAQGEGGQVRKGEKGHMIVKYGTYEKKTLDESGEPEKAGYLRAYTVFNAAQIDGIDFPAIEYGTDHHAIPAAEAIVEGMPNPPHIVEGQRPSYQVNMDTVTIPPLGIYHAPEAYYIDLFHEITHATGHCKRLDRPSLTAKVSITSTGENRKIYSKEELIAEMGAAFLAAEAGIVADFEESASYLQGWLDVLKVKDNRTWIVSAASQAQKAADYVLNR